MPNYNNGLYNNVTTPLYGNAQANMQNAYYPGIAAQNYAFQQQSSMPLVYVHGREGANAYQLPPGVTKQLLWDDEVNRFYIKAIDEYGRPKIVADNDFFPHVEEPKNNAPGSNVDMSDYPTRHDIEEFLSKFDTSKFLTKKDLDDALNNLVLGAQGRIVRNEPNA